MMDDVARYNQERWKALTAAKADPGSWDHYTAFAPPWLSILSRLDN